MDVHTQHMLACIWKWSVQHDAWYVPWVRHHTTSHHTRQASRLTQYLIMQSISIVMFHLLLWNGVKYIVLNNQPFQFEEVQENVVLRNGHMKWYQTSTENWKLKAERITASQHERHHHYIPSYSIKWNSRIYVQHYISSPSTSALGVNNLGRDNWYGSDVDVVVVWIVVGDKNMERMVVMLSQIGL